MLDGFTVSGGNANGSYPDSHGGGMINVSGSPRIANVTFSGNSAANCGGGMFNRNSTGSPRLANVTFSGNSAARYGGGMYNFGNSSPTLTHVTFSGNSAANGGGGMYNATSSATLTNVIFSGNSAGAWGGGGILNRDGSSLTLVNVTFSRNSAANGGGLLTFNGSNATLTNVTFSGNAATSGTGGGVYNKTNSTSTLVNCILWGNTATVSDPQVYSDAGTSVTYSDVQGDYPGAGNINVNPLFVDAPNDDLRLRPWSRAVDAGDNAAPGLSSITTDLAGHARFADTPPVPDTGNGTAPIVDMGAHEASVLYVDLDATGANDGSSWANAYTSLQTAFKYAGIGVEIWVAEGTYTPGTARTRTFTLKNGVALYGGFAGAETARSQRDWVAHPTVLSGEIGAAGNSDNVYHVVTGSGTDGTAVLDGFTISSGNADGSDADNRGGGMYNLGGSPRLASVTFSGNSATLLGGGMYDDMYSNPTLTDVTFSGNSASSGGGMMNGLSNPTLTDVTFSGNSASSGGGMLNSSSSPTLTNVIFTGNSASSGGGGMENTDSNPALINVTFSGNSTSGGGGGMNNNNVSNPTLTNVTFSGNSASLGGGMYNLNSNPSLTNCILWGNTASSGSQIYDSSSTPAVTYSDVQGSYAGTGNVDADPLFVDADGPDDVAGTLDDNLRLRATSPAVDAGDNTAPGLSGVATDLGGHARFADVPFVADTGNGTPPIVDMGAYEARLLYVDRSATGADDGSSWADAFTDLQAALTAAVSSDEIWVARGTYTPGTVRTATYQLESGVAIYGGFAGTETSRGQRDWVAHPTVLSGDVGTPGDDSDNVYHVVTGSGTDNTAVLDGFTVSGGNANGSYPDSHGGGMINVSGSPRLANVTFSGNSAANCGGGMFNRNSAGSPRLANVTFSGNSAARYGGGMYNFGNSSPTLTHVTFSGNSASIHGGGMFNHNGSSPTLTDVSFSGNSAANGGGGMYNATSSATLTNVIFSGNSAGAWGGGGIVNRESSSLTLVNVTFSGNSAANGGGLLTFNGSNTTLTNVTFIGNAATSGVGGGVYNKTSSTSTLVNCILWGNTATVSDPQVYSDAGTSVTYNDVQGGYPGTGNVDADPLFVDAPNGDLRLRITSPAIDAGDNSAVPAGVTTDLDGYARFSDIAAVADTGSGTAPIVDMGAYEARPLYVDQSATGADDGTSWADAYTDLQSALSAAATSDEIWVAEGTYTPGTDRSATFQLGSGVALYGGFAGTETAHSQRDWTAHPTVLSGDVGTPGDDSDNVYHVVTGSGADASAVLDGFTIIGGNANGTSADRRGGGMYTASGSPTLASLTFSGNSASDRGSGMYSYDSGGQTLTNVTFSDNSCAINGGGMYNDHGNPRLTNVTFSGNSARNGGGVYNEVSNATLTNVTFSDNSVTAWGGGMLNWASDPTLINVIFSGNSASTGGGIYNENASSPQLANCILWGNTASSNPQIANTGGSTSAISTSDVQGSGGSASWDAALGTDGGGNIDADPLFVDAPSGDLRLQPASPAIDAGDDTAVPAGITTDLDGNPRIIGAAVDMGAFETLPAVVSITRAAANPTNAASAPFTVTFNVPVAGVDANAFALTTTGGQGGAMLGTISGSGTTWTVSVSTVDDATGTIRLDLEDTDTITATPGVPLGGTGAGNGDFSAGEVYTVDRVVPTVSVASTTPDPTNLATIPVTVTFSEDVSGFSAEDVTAVNATVDNFSSVSAAVYTFDLTPSGQGPVTADVAAGVAQDGAGNGNAAAAQFTITYDSVGPTVSVASTAPDPTNLSPIPVTVTFDEDVSGFTAEDVTAGNGTLDNFATVSGSVYTFDLTPSGQGPVTADVAAGVAQDGAGNGNAAAAQFTITYDSVGPTVSTSSAVPDPTNLPTIPVMVTFSEEVSGLTAGDVTAGNGTVDNLATVSGSVYTFDLTPSGQGPVTADVAAGVAQDGAGNGNAAAAQFSITYDSVAPAVTIDQAAGQPDPSGSAPISFTVVFAEPVTGFEGSDVDFSASTAPGPLGADVTEVAPLDGTTYHVAVGGMTGPGDVIASLLAGVVTDAAGNPNAPSTSTDNTVTFDPVVPIVTGVRRAAPDPTNAASLPFTVTFAKPVSGVDATDFTLTTDGTLSGASVAGVSGSGATWTVTVDTGSGSGTLRLDVVDDDSIRDAAANPLGGPGAGNGDFTAGELYTVDRAAPTVSQLDAPDVAEFGATVYTITVVYADNLALDGSSLGDGDLRVTGSGDFDQLATFVGVTPLGDGTPRTATYRITPPGGTWDDPDRGDYTVALEAGQVRDTVGNAAAEATLGTFNVDGSYQVFLPLVSGSYTVAPDLIVERIVASGNDVQVVVKNRGNAPVTDEFWVQAYVDPHPAPSAVNQLWYDLGDQGMFWGVLSSTLPLAPGEAITLTYGDAYYWPSVSRFDETLPAGTPVYAQVDAYNDATSYGAVWESHEILGGAYNNVAGPVYSAGTAVSGGRTGPEPGTAGRPRDVSRTHLPPLPGQ